MTESEILTGLPGYQIAGIESNQGEVRPSARHTAPIACPHCLSRRLRSKGRYQRQVRHENWGTRRCILLLEVRKWQCRDCGRHFRQRLPGILPWQRASEASQRLVFRQHQDGINRSRLAGREGIGAATVERCFQRGLQRQFAACHSTRCPPVLGLDEHFFTRRLGYAATLCDLRHHKVHDVVLGRPEAAPEACFQRLEGKAGVRVVCMDLASHSRALVRKHFPNARIVAGRFHVIRLINHHFLACWRELDPAGSKNRGLLSLMRRHRHKLTPDQQTRLLAYLAQHPALERIYRFKQRLCYLLLKKHRTRKQCESLAPRLLRVIYRLRQAGLAQWVSLGDTLHAWAAGIAAMWRFTRNNGITEGFHTKMELIHRQAFGFRNFQNYRLRVKV